MPCYKPLQAWRQPGALKTGEPRIVFARHDQAAKPLDLPCGQCIGCRLERSRRWAVRLMHEATLHEKSCFLTLTYNDSHLPSDGSLKVEDFQLFMKRLRRGSAGPLRFFHCGEYGERFARPHYHCVLFGEDFRSDRVLSKTTDRGDSIYVSPRLSELWGKGDLEQQMIGELTFESAAYVARYCLKKVTGKRAESHYEGRKPEYVTMSRRPGIGAGWLEKWGISEVYRDDTVVMRGKEMMPPPFYDKLLEAADPALFERIKKQRVRASKAFAEGEDSRSRRLMDREEVKKQTIANTLRRSV